MAKSRKRLNLEIEEDTLPSVELLINNFHNYETEESRIRFLDRLRKSPGGLDTMNNAKQTLKERMAKLDKDDYFPDNIVKKYKSYVLLLKQITAALERGELEKATGANLSIYSPTLGRQ